MKLITSVTLCIVGTLAVSGYMSYDGYKNHQDYLENKERIAQMKEMENSNQKERAQVANSLGTDEGAIRKLIHDYEYLADQLDYKNPVLNMGYEYMTEQLQSDVKRSFEPAVKKSLQTVINNKGQVKIEKLDVKSVKINQDEITATALFTFTQLISEDHKPIERITTETTMYFTFSSRNIWLISGMEFRTTSKEKI